MSDTMNYTLKDLLDIPKLQALLDALDEIHSLPSAIIDAEGNILTATAWQDICTKFHRANPEAAKKCVESDSYIAKELDKHPSHVVYKCPFGLVDTATPIVVEGRHLGNVFTGQLFTEPPDEARFIRQAREYGFAEQEYLAALRKVPVISEERLRKNLAFLQRFTEMLALQGLVHLRQFQTEAVLRKKEAFLNTVIDTMPIGVWLADNSGKLIKGNVAGQKIWEGSRYVGKEQYNEYNGWWADTRERIKPEEWSLARAISKGETSLDEIIDIECFDGTRKTIINASAPIRGAGQKIIGAVVVNQDITERRKVEVALKESEERLREAQRLARMGSWEWNMERGILTWSDEVYRIFGLEPGAVEPSAALFESTIHPDDREDFLTRREKMLAEKQSASIDHRIVLPDGEVRYVQETAQLIFDGQGQVMRVIGIVQDITDRKRMEETLHNVQVRLRTILQTVSEPILVKDNDHRLVLVNRAFCDLFSLDESAVIGKTLAEQVPEDERAHFLKVDRQVLDSGIPDVREENLTVEGFTRTIVTSKTRFVDTSGKRFLVGSIHDITDYKKAEQALQNAKEYAEQLIETANAIVIGLDSTGNISVFNQAAEAITGYSKAEMSGRNWFEVMVPKDRYPQVWTEFERLTTGGIPKNFENPILTKSGDERYIVWQNNEVFEQGRIVGTISFGMDITERKKAEEALKKSRILLASSIESQKDTIILSIDTKYRYLYFNKAHGDAMRSAYNKNIEIGMNILDCITSDADRNSAKENYGRALMGESHSNVRKYGVDERAFFESYFNPILNDDGEIVGATALARNITERIAAEASRERVKQELQNSEARLREAQKIGKIGSWELDVASGKLWWSDEVYELFGLKPGAGPSFETFLQKIHPEDRQRVSDASRDSITNKSTNWQIEYRIVLESGDVRFMHESATTVLDAGGRVVSRRGIVQDITERKRTEMALRESIVQFQALVDQSLTGVALLQEGTFVYVNPYLAQIIGYEPKEMIGRAPVDFVVEEDRKEVRERIRQRLSGEVDEARYTFRARHKTGREVILEVFGRATTYQGKPASLSTLMDITERKKLEDVARLDHRRMESLLKISQSKTTSLKELLDYALDESVALSESKLGYIYFYNEEKREFTLHSWSKAVMKECAISDPPKTYQLEKTGIWGEAVRQRKPIVVNDFHAPHPLKKGYPEGHAPLHRFMTLPVFVGGRIVAVVGVANKEAEYDNGDVLQLASMMDSIWKIAEGRKMDDDLRKLSQAVEQSPVSIVITDTQGNIEFVNPRFTQVTGYRLDEVLGRNPRVLQSGETPRETYTALWETITTGRVWEGDLHNKKKNGQLFWEHAAISPIRDSDGNISHYLGIKEDTTERKKLEEQLRQAQKMEAIGQLAGGVAHDFNNILSTITGYASLLEMAITSDATLREYISEISVASERGANLTQSLLAFSRKQEPSLSAVDLNAQIRNSHKILSRLVGEDIDLVLDLDREDLVAEADAGQLQQVLMNLAANARDAMPSGGTLRIETRTDSVGSDRLVRYALEHPGRYAVLSVTDTGGGMEQAVRERIFEPFYTTKGVGKGTGLGLSIVYGIVKKHRGSITVDSEPGKGTSFSIYLPLSERSVRGHGASESKPFAAQGNRTILVVEDEEPVRRVLKLTLEAYGYRVIEAVDGEDAVRVFREHKDKVQLVLCDLVMPKKNGKVACDEIRAIRPDIKAIFMSGYTKDIFDQKGISDTDITMLIKPVKPQDLLRTIGEVLEGPQRPS